MMTSDATDEAIIREAQTTYGSDDVDVLDIAPDRVDGGAWVRALVWVPLDEADDEWEHAPDDLDSYGRIG